MSSLDVRIAFGTKAETLERLRGRLQTCSVLGSQCFTVAEWKAGCQAVLEALQARFGGARLIVRSSARSEDGPLASMAGAFRSCLDVDGSQAACLRQAVNEVVASYRGDPTDQVLVQPMLTEVEASGVIMTRELNHGGPWYVINYDDESGRTDKITGGHGVNKTVMVHRAFDSSFIESPRIAELLAMTQELESIFGVDVPLDIEFARDRDALLYLLQVRPMPRPPSWTADLEAQVASTLQDIEAFFQRCGQARPDLAGSRTILGQMPDWNPAEMIGTHPRPLAISLYRRLITDSVWREARATMGYRQPGSECLMVTLAGHPYIDVRNSFNTFLPAALDEEAAGRLIDAWMERLAEHPEWHDKVEFEVAQTLVDFTFDETFETRYPGCLDRPRFDAWKIALQALTRASVNLSAEGSLGRALADVRRLQQVQETRGQTPLEAGGDLWWLNRLLDECVAWGTRPFAVVARHAFMAEALLASAVARGALTAARQAQFKHSLVTVAGQFAQAYEEVVRGTGDRRSFLSRYGHLRPGTYDIRSRRYDQQSNLFGGGTLPARAPKPEAFRLTPAEHGAVASLLTEAGLTHLSPDELVAYARMAIAGREEAKFIFTRHLSDMLEIVAQWGQRIGFNRDDLSYLSLDQVLDQGLRTGPGRTESLRTIMAGGRQSESVTGSLRLACLIREVKDIYVAPLHRSAPTFITQQRVVGPIGLVNGAVVGDALHGRIACIENADPGYDWLFSRNITALVTKFGGANSHMAIRCAELALPAAIGVGEQTFDRIVASGHAEMDCSSKVVRPVHG